MRPTETATPFASGPGTWKSGSPAAFTMSSAAAPASAVRFALVPNVQPPLRAMTTEPRALAGASGEHASRGSASAIARSPLGGPVPKWPRRYSIGDGQPSTRR